MFNFQQCPCCAHGEKLLEGTAEVLGKLIDRRIAARIDSPIVLAELLNINNAIKNRAERLAIVAPKPVIDSLLE